MMEEVWAEIEGFSDYAVSNYGRVSNTKFNRILEPRPNSYGYMRVSLSQNGVVTDFYIHRLVAKTFIGGYNPSLRVFHHDEDNANNHVNNLRFRSGKRMGHFNRKTESPKYRRVQIVETGHIFRTVEDCARYIKGSASSIWRVLRGDRLSYLGYTFNYIYEED